MKKSLLLLIFLAILNKTYGQTPSNIILGDIIDTEGEYVFINTGKDKEVAIGMIFGIYNLKNEAIGVCEISKTIKKGNYIASILTQTDEIKKGYTALSDIEKEHKLREKIKELKVSVHYLDSYKKFEASINGPIDITSSDTAVIKDKILRKIFCQSMRYLDIQIPKFSNPGEISPNTYGDIIDESSILQIDNINGKVNVETTINIGKLKKLLEDKGYTFKPKMVRLVFLAENNAATIKQVVDGMLKHSNYIAQETEDIRDVTSPVSCIIYTTPQIFADEINTFDFEGIGISVSKVHEDTIELKVW
ncbi:MAG: hypothetical protein ABII25_01575 [bacterium]